MFQLAFLFCIIAFAFSSTEPVGGYADLLFAYNAGIKEVMNSDTYLTTFSKFLNNWDLLYADVITHDLDFVSYPLKIKEGGVLDLALKGEYTLKINYVTNSPWVVAPTDGSAEPTGYDVTLAKAVFTAISNHYSSEEMKTVWTNKEPDSFSVAFTKTFSEGSDAADLWISGSSLQSWRKALSYSTMNYIEIDRGLLGSSAAMLNVQTISQWNTFSGKVCVEKGSSNEADLGKFLPNAVPVVIEGTDSVATAEMIRRVQLVSSDSDYCDGMFSLSQTLTTIQSDNTDLSDYQVRPCPDATKRVPIVNYIRPDPITETADSHDAIVKALQAAGNAIGSHSTPNWFNAITTNAGYSTLPADLPYGSILRDAAARAMVTVAHSSENVFDVWNTGSNCVSGRKLIDANSLRAYRDVNASTLVSNLGNVKILTCGDDFDIISSLAAEYLKTVGINSQYDNDGTVLLDNIAWQFKDEQWSDQLIADLDDASIVPPVSFVYDNTVASIERGASAQLIPFGTLTASIICQQTGFTHCDSTWLDWLEESTDNKICVCDADFTTPFVMDLYPDNYVFVDTVPEAMDKVDNGDCSMFIIDTSFAVSTDVTFNYQTNVAMLGGSGNEMTLTYAMATRLPTALGGPDGPTPTPEEEDSSMLTFIAIGVGAVALILAVVALVVGCRSDNVVLKGNTMHAGRV